MKNLIFSIFYIIVFSSLSAQNSYPIQTDNGTFLYYDDNISFPIGIYVRQPNTNHLSILANAGFDFSYLYFSNGNINPYLDSADDLGFKVIPHWVSGNPNFINNYKNNPAILGWGLHDDANWSDYTPAEFAEDAATIRMDDTNHIIHSSVVDNVNANYPDYTLYFPSLEVVNVQAYAIGGPDEFQSVERIFNDSKALVETAEMEGKVPLLASQSFSYDENPPRFPTYAESDAIFYAAIVAGIKGIIYYILEDDNNDYIYDTQPELWSAITNNLNELNTVLKPVLIYGSRTTLELNDYVFVAYWVYNDTVYIIAVNTGNETEQVSFSLDIDVSGQLDDVFTNRQSNLIMDEDIISGSLNQKEVSIQSIPVSTLGIERISNNKIILYPNPIKNEINIKFESYSTSIYEVSIVDMTGKVLRKLKAKNDVMKIDISNLTSGFYMISVVDAEQKVFHKKIIIE
jgi:hypothetical protein